MRARFPAAELYPCEWHLRHALEWLMTKIGSEGRHQKAIDTLASQLEAAFAGPMGCGPFVDRAHAAGIPRLNTTRQVVEDQFCRRGARSSRSADTPLSTSPLDRVINPIRAAIRRIQPWPPGPSSARVSSLPLIQTLRGRHGTGSGSAFWDDCALCQGDPNAGYLEPVETLSLT